METMLVFVSFSGPWTPHKSLRPNQLATQKQKNGCFICMCVSVLLNGKWHTDIFSCGADAWKAAHHEHHQHHWAIRYWPDKIITPFPLRLKPHTTRPLRNMDRTCKMVKGQVNAINYFLTVMAMQESLTFPHSLSPCNVMGLSDSFVRAFAVVGPRWHLERDKRSVC